jgi:hypothetical protein
LPSQEKRAFSEAKRLLLNHGFRCEVSLKEFHDWLDVSTVYPDASRDEVLSRPLLVAHELVELGEVKQMGLPIVKDVIPKNLQRIYEAHLNAFEVEMSLATQMNEWGHIRTRLKDIETWIEDPLLPRKLRPRCKMLYAKAEAQTQRR